MNKNFDANGTDIDAYPDRAFIGGVYERRNEMRTIHEGDSITIIRKNGKVIQLKAQQGGIKLAVGDAISIQYHDVFIINKDEITAVLASLKALENKI